MNFAFSYPLTEFKYLNINGTVQKHGLITLLLKCTKIRTQIPIDTYTNTLCRLKICKKPSDRMS